MRFGLGLAGVTLAVGLMLTHSAPASAESWIEPTMRMMPDRGPPTIALTFDACSGKADHRIIDMLIAARVPATLFVTGTWVRRNPEVMARLLLHKDLFQFENHGRRHLLATARNRSVYGLTPAASAEAVINEIEGGRSDIHAVTGLLPGWYRGAAAIYTRTGMELVAHLGQRLAGYSLAPDGGARLSRRATHRNVLSARDGDVLLLHINHPERPAGQGIAQGILDLKARGYRFVRLNTVGLRFSHQP